MWRHDVALSLTQSSILQSLNSSSPQVQIALLQILEVTEILRKSTEF